MDKLIKRVSSDLKGSKCKGSQKAKKDLKVLLKADKKQDAKVEKLEKKEHKKK